MQLAGECSLFAIISIADPVAWRQGRGVSAASQLASPLSIKRKHAASAGVAGLPQRGALPQALFACIAIQQLRAVGLLGAGELC